MPFVWAGEMSRPPTFWEAFAQGLQGALGVLLQRHLQQQEVEQRRKLMQEMAELEARQQREAEERRWQEEERRWREHELPYQQLQAGLQAWELFGGEIPPELGERVERYLGVRPYTQARVQERVPAQELLPGLERGLTYVPPRPRLEGVPELKSLEELGSAIRPQVFREVTKAVPWRLPTWEERQQAETWEKIAPAYTRYLLEEPWKRAELELKQQELALKERELQQKREEAILQLQAKRSEKDQELANKLVLQQQEQLLKEYNTFNSNAFRVLSDLSSVLKGVNADRAVDTLTINYLSVVRNLNPKDPVHFDILQRASETAAHVWTQRLVDLAKDDSPQGRAQRKKLLGYLNSLFVPKNNAGILSAEQFDLFAPLLRDAGYQLKIVKKKDLGTGKEVPVVVWEEPSPTRPWWKLW